MREAPFHENVESVYIRNVRGGVAGRVKWEEVMKKDRRGDGEKN